MEIEKAKYKISSTFKITGRGIVFAGTILEGTIHTGDYILFEFKGQLIEKKITGIDTRHMTDQNKPNAGILLTSKDQEEIEAFLNWDPQMTVGRIVARS